MIQKGLAAVAALLLLAQSHPAVFGQRIPAASLASHLASLSAAQRPRAVQAPADRSGPTAQSPANGMGASPAPAQPEAARKDSTPATPATTSNPAPNTDCYGANCEIEPQHISIATPAPAPAPWTWQERVTWGAQIVLAVLGYAAILMALSLMRKIERQTRAGEAAAEAAQSLAQNALAQTQALLRAERPWLVISVLPSPTVENGFLVMATNRGRGAARIVSTVHDTLIVADESKLPSTPEYRNPALKPAEPRFLLPGETTELLSFSRGDVKKICANDDQFTRVEKWEDKVYLFGQVMYRDLAAVDDEIPHESSWFCWYIHGRQKSGMITANLTAYNRHT